MTSSKPSTVVLQSHRDPLPHPWLQPCLDSVRAWAASQNYEYRFIGDELFDVLSPQEQEICASQPVVASDLARLRLCQRVLQEGVSRVVWCDADSLVVEPTAVALVSDGCAFGRELWLQEAAPESTGRPRLYKKIHNALMQFTAADPVLDFYEFAATRMLAKHGQNARNALKATGKPAAPMVAQLLGPKFLSHLHNVVEFQVLEHAQVMSPVLAHALLACESRLLERYRGAWEVPPAVVNLSASEVLRGSIDDAQMQRLVELLLEQGAHAFSTEPGFGNSSRDQGYDFGRIVVGIKKGD